MMIKSLAGQWYKKVSCVPKIESQHFSGPTPLGPDTQIKWNVNHFFFQLQTQMLAITDSYLIYRFVLFVFFSCFISADHTIFPL